MFFEDIFEFEFLDSPRTYCFTVLTPKPPCTLGTERLRLTLAEGRLLRIAVKLAGTPLDISSLRVRSLLLETTLLFLLRALGCLDVLANLDVPSLCPWILGELIDIILWAEDCLPKDATVALDP